MTEFDFSGSPYTRATGSNVEFSFGSNAPVELQVSAQLPKLSPNVRVIAGKAELQVSAALPTLKVSASVGRSISLLFEQQRSTSTDLIFGGGSEVSVTEARLVAKLPGPTANIALRPLDAAFASAKLPGLTTSIAVRPLDAAFVSAKLPGLTSNSWVLSAVGASMSAMLPAPTFAAFGLTTVGVAVGAALPALTFQGVALPPVGVAVGATLPAPTFRGFVLPPVGASVDAALPAPTFEAMVLEPMLLGVAAALPGPVPKFRIGTIAEVQVAATLPDPTVNIEARRVAPISMVAHLPGPTFDAEARYFSRTTRPTVAEAGSGFQGAQRNMVCGATTEQQSVTNAPVGWDAFWQKTIGELVTVEHPLPYALVKSPVANKAKFQDASREHDAPDFKQQDGTPIWKDRSGIFQNATSVFYDKLFKHQDGTPIKPWYLSLFENATKFHKLGHFGDFQAASPFIAGSVGRFQDAMVPPIGITLPPEKPKPPKPYEPRDEDLVFCWLASESTPSLIFGLKCQDPNNPEIETVVVPVQKAYIVINNVNLHRVSDNAVLPTLALSLSLDAGSWTWAFDATVPAKYQGLVEPVNGPVELRATINGVEFRVLAESMSRERVFGQSNLRISGRGRNAVLDAPYAPITGFVNTTDRTANQLAEDALLYNGVNVGGAEPWAIQWGLTDWLVPAGAFVHQGSHISALNTIAQAAGGYLQPHRTQKVLRILPKYPQAPWAWANVTPDFELPSAVTVSESVRWEDKARYNRVFVSGQQGGVLGQVTRAGTAGDLVAQMVTDALITHADAARQRGLSILADTGRIATVGLSLPVLAQTGVIEPGKFVRYVDGGVTRLGIVRSTSVQVGASAVDTMQQLTLETHE